MSVSKVVKRYANRKLYDTDRSCYVTLEDISVMIRSGDEIKVVDNKTGEDLTTVTLAQIIFEAEKKKKFMPLTLLRGLVLDSGGVIRDRMGQVSAKAQEVKQSAAKLRQEFEDRFEQALQQAQPPATEGKQGTAAGAIAELVVSSKNAFEELQKNVEEKIKGPVGAVARYASVGRDMEEIKRRMAELEQRLANLPQ
jgi:polyhydroxyalkanoate synthesis repressor PhaR